MFPFTPNNGRQQYSAWAAIALMFGLGISCFNG